MAGSVTGLMPHLITIRRAPAGTPDAYGNTDAAYADDQINVKARIQHHNSWEDREDRRVNVENWRGYIDPVADVLESDMLFWQDESRTFEILVVEPVYGRTSIHHKYVFLQEIF